MTDNDLPDKLTREDKEFEKYTADRIMDYAGTNDGTNYEKFWYGYDASGGAYESAAHIPHHIIRHYWKLKTHHI